MPRSVFGGQKGSARRESKSPTPLEEPTPDASLLEADLLKMKKVELVDLAGSLGIAVAPKATKAIITAAILAI